MKVFTDNTKAHAGFLASIRHLAQGGTRKFPLLISLFHFVHLINITLFCKCCVRKPCITLVTVELCRVNVRKWARKWFCLNFLEIPNLGLLLRPVTTSIKLCFVCRKLLAVSRSRKIRPSVRKPTIKRTVGQWWGYDGCRPAIEQNLDFYWLLTSKRSVKFIDSWLFLLDISWLLPNYLSSMFAFVNWIKKYICMYIKMHLLKSWKGFFFPHVG